MKKLGRYQKWGMIVGIVLLASAGFFGWINISYGVNKVWKGTVDSSWSNGNNWSPVGVPGSGDVAVFDNTCTGCDVTIDANVNIAGVDMQSTYVGTITHTTHTITVGTSGWVQAGGTFAGGSGDIAVVSPTNASGATTVFALSGGIFTSTSGVLTVGYSYNLYAATIFDKSGGTFNHNNGTVRFSTNGGWNPGCHTISVTGSLDLYSVVIDYNTTYSVGYMILSGTVTVLGNFTFEDGFIQGGEWDVAGNLIIQSNADGGTSLVRMYGASSATYSNTNGFGPYLKIDKDPGISVTPATGTTQLYVNKFWLQEGEFTAPSGIMRVGYRLGGYPFEIDATIFNKAGGTFQAGTTGLVYFSTYGGGYGGATHTISVTGSLTLHSAQIDFNSGYLDGPYRINLSGTITLTGDFVHEDGILNGGMWNIGGNVSILCPNAGSNDCAQGGSATLSFTGGSNQTYTDQGGNEPDGDITINKTGGTLTLASNADWNASGQDVTLAPTNAGTFSQGSYNFITNNLTLSGGSYTKSTGAMTVSAYTQSSGTFSGGSGDVTIGGVFTLSGGTFQSTQGLMRMYSFSNYCNGAPGSGSTIFSYSSGVFDPNGGTLKFDNEGGCEGHALNISIAAPSFDTYNVIFDRTSNYSSVSYIVDGTINTENDFTHSDGALADGTINVKRNVTIGSASEGVIKTQNLVPTTVRMYGSIPATYTYSGSGIGDHLVIDKDAGVAVSPSGGTTSLTVDRFSLLGGIFTAPSGTFAVAEPSRGCYYGNGHTMFRYSGGVFDYDTNKGLLSLSETSVCAPFNSYIQIDLPLTVYKLLINHTNSYAGQSYTLSGSSKQITVKNIFTHQDGAINGGSIAVEGNVLVKSTADGGTTTLAFTGGNNQTYTDQGGNEPDGNITINKTGGTVSTSTNVDWNATNQNVMLTSGSLVVGGAGNINLAGTGGKLTVASGAELVMNGTGTMTLGAGTGGYSVTNNGRISLRSSGSCGGTDAIKIRSTLDGTRRNWNGSGSSVMYDVDVKDMSAGSPISMLSSTITNCNSNWVNISNTCPSQAITVPTGRIDVINGTVLVK